jgi:hypothetical protein
MYSEHGFEARIGPEAGHVCQSLMVVWNCTPGSAVAVRFDRLEELVGDAHRVVGVLAGYREVGLRIEVGIVDRERDVFVALAGELDHALDVGVGYVVRARRLDLTPQDRVLGGVEAVVA